MQPLVSILIPAYNSQEWIADTLKSALSQTWQRKEIIVVDDGSTDQTLSIAQQFASKSTAIVRQENQGAASARNKAYSLCQGDYIQWLDADDLLNPRKIAVQLKAAERGSTEKTLFSCAWGRFLLRPEKARFIPTSLWCDLAPKEWLLRKMQQNVFMQTAAWLVSRSLCIASGPWDTRLRVDDDGEYFCRVLLKSDLVRFVPEASVFYRVSGPGSLSYIGRSELKMEAQFASIRMHIDYLRSLEDSQRVQAACLQYLRDWLPFFYPERSDLVLKMRGLAEEMGGELPTPQLPMKYRWVEKLFGYGYAKQAQDRYNRFKISFARTVDKVLSRGEIPMV